jgi:hypothetical protein
MIQLKSILTEQTFNAKTIAEKIYDSKGTFLDDENGAINIIKSNIKNITQYRDVSKELKKLTSNRGIAEYLRSFMNFKDLYRVADHLVKVLPENSWEWTVKKVFTWEDLIEEISSRRPGAGGVVPDSSKRPTEAQTLKMLFATWGKNPATSIKNDLLYKMLMHPSLYRLRTFDILDAFEKYEFHQGLFNASALISMIPGAGYIGSALASAILAYDAKVYYDEGNKGAAALSLAFAALPLIGPVVSRIPAIQKFKQAALVKLGNKVSKFKSFNKTGSFKSITPEEFKLLSKEEAELVREFQKNEKFLFDSVRTPMETWKAVLKDPKLKALKQSMSPEEWQKLHSGIMNGKYTYEDVKNIATKHFAAKGLAINAGIKFTSAELQSLDQITDDIVKTTQTGTNGWDKIYFKSYVIRDASVRAPFAARYDVVSKTLQKHTKILPGQPRMVTQDIKVKLVTMKTAQTMNMGNTRGWATHTGEIYMVPEKFVDKSGQLNKQQFKSVLTHELAHIKDPAIKQSPKLNKTYNANAGQAWTFNPDAKNPKQNWFKNYYFHDIEQSALRPQALEQIVYGTNKLSKKFGKARTLKVLDDAIQFFATNDSKYFTKDVQELLFGSAASKFGENRSVTTLFNTLSANNPEGYKKLSSAIVKQLSANKHEVSRMRNIADGIIKLKDLL